jgi:hypothetical protein
MSTITVTTFKWVPPIVQGLVRDLRVRWALEEARAGLCDAFDRAAGSAVSGVSTPTSGSIRVGASPATLRPQSINPCNINYLQVLATNQCGVFGCRGLSRSWTAKKRILVSDSRSTSKRRQHRFIITECLLD